MTIQEAIDRTDSLKPNQYTQEEKIRWLSWLDAKIQKDIIDTHEKENTAENKALIAEQEEQREEQTEGTVPYSPDETEQILIAPFPYDELYVAYLKMKIDEENGETARYNNSAILFNSMMNDYAKAYHREHIPKGLTRIKKW